MSVYLVAPAPLGALLIGWAVGWSLGLLILLAATLALGFGTAFWWCWDAWPTPVVSSKTDSMRRVRRVNCPKSSLCELSRASPRMWRPASDRSAPGQA
jgi:hypothetical protein